MKIAVSTLTLALALSLSVPAFAQTTADADVFVAKAEKELGEYIVFASRVQWINNTYLTDDTDAVAAKIGAQGTEMQVRLAGEAAKYQALPGLSADTKRKLDFLRGGLPARTND